MNLLVTFHTSHSLNFPLFSIFVLKFKMKQDKLKMQTKKEPGEVNAPQVQVPVYWLETSDTVSRRYEFEPDGYLSVSVISLTLA